MLIEASTLIGLDVVDARGQKLGSVETCIFNGVTTKLAGFGVNRPGLLSKIVALPYDRVMSLDRARITVKDADIFEKNSQPFDELLHRYGRLLGVTARTESGSRIGKIEDVLIEAETGLIIRLYLRYLLREQIIPRQFLVSLSPQAVVFKDIVNRPIFNQIASAEAKA